jgi:hypothetical protein
MAPREGQEALLRTLHAREWRGCAGSRVCRVWGGPEGSAGEEEWSGRRREGGGQSAVQRWQRRRRRRRRRRREGDRRAAAGPRGEARRGERGAVAAEEPQLQLGRAGPGQARTSGGGGGSGSGSGGGSIAPGAGTGEASGRARCSGPLLHSPGLCLFLCRLLFHRRSCWGSRRARARAPRQSTSWVPSCLRGRRLVSSDLERAPGGGRGGRGGRPRAPGGGRGACCRGGGPGGGGGGGGGGPPADPALAVRGGGAPRAMARKLSGVRAAPELGDVQGTRTPKLPPSQLSPTPPPGFPSVLGGPPFSQLWFPQARDTSSAADIDPGLGASPLPKGGFQL